MNRQLIDDMLKLFCDRLLQLLQDHADLCDRADIEHPVTVRLLMTGLLGELTLAALAVQMTEDEFAALCRNSHQTARRNERRKKAKH
jgi:hypothetical protein